MLSPLTQRLNFFSPVACRWSISTFFPLSSIYLPHCISRTHLPSKLSSAVSHLFLLSFPLISAISSMAEVAGLLLSPFLQVLFERVASREFLDFFRSRKLDRGLLKRLEIVLLSANVVLEDAEEMQFTKPMVKKWLDEFKDAVYDAEDILDEIQTEVLQCKLDAEFLTVATKFYLKNCPEVESFPEGGLASKLIYISIIDCDKLFANRRDWGLQNLPSIQVVTIQDNCKDVESFPEAGLLPANLVSLDISNFPNMKSLDYKALRQLTSLDRLWISSCPMLKFMEEEGLPASICTLGINQCALLEKQLQSRKGKVWRKIAAPIPRIKINGTLI